MKTPSRNKIRQSSLRTRELLIDAARQLFARFGVEKTTMNDIAEASKRGRRTVYMYFNSKSDVFYAVVGRELDLLCKRLEAVAESEGSAPEKLMSLIYTHMDTILQVVMRNGSLKAQFFNDIGRVERVRYKFDLREQDIIASILGARCQDDCQYPTTRLQGAGSSLHTPANAPHGEPRIRFLTPSRRVFSIPRRWLQR